MHTSSRVGWSFTLLLGAMWLNSILQYLTPLTVVLRGEAKSTHYPVKRSTDLSFFFLSDPYLQLRINLHYKGFFFDNLHKQKLALFSYFIHVGGLVVLKKLIFIKFSKFKV